MIEGERRPGEPRGRDVERHAGHRRGWRRAERVKVAAADHLAGPVDAGPRTRMTAEGPEVRDLAALPEDGVARRHRRGRESTAGRLPLIVDREGDAETEVLHDSVLPDERMHLMGGDLALAGDETGIADSMRDAAAAAEGPEVRHDAVVPQERTRL